jgi:hypothetical protein
MPATGKWRRCRAARHHDDEGEHFAALELEIDGVEDDQVGVAGAVDFGEFFGAKGDVGGADF